MDLATDNSARDRDGPPGDQALLVLGATDEGMIVHVSQVARGRACGCFCPACKEPLQARKGDIRAHHFAHLPSSACDPLAAIEAALHAYALQVLGEERHLLLPPVVAEVPGGRQALRDAVDFAFDDIRLDEPARGEQPSIVVAKRGRELLVVVSAGRKVPPHKVAEIRRRKQSAIALELGGVARETDLSLIRRAVIEAAPRRWIYNKRHEEAVEEQRARRRAEAARLLSGGEERPARLTEAERVGIGGPPSVGDLGMTAEQQVDEAVATMMEALARIARARPK